MKRLSNLLMLVACALLATSCGRNMAGNTYTSSSAAGKVLEGKIISVRKVTIKDHDRLGQNATGGLMGGAAGAGAGSAIGSGSGNTGATIGGAIAGAIAGAMIEDALSTSEGMEYLVKLDAKHKRSGTKHQKRINTDEKNTVEQDIQTATAVESSTDIVSVVQAEDPALHKGSRVYVIYSDDRPRLTPAD